MKSKLYLSAVFALLVTACTQQPEQGYNTSQNEYQDSQQYSQQYREDDGFGVGEFVAGAAVGHLLTNNSSNSNNREREIRTVERVYVKDNTGNAVPEVKKDKPIVPAAVKSPPQKSTVVKKSVLENVKVKKSVAPKPMAKKPVAKKSVYKKTVSLKKKSYSSSKSSSKRKK